MALPISNIPILAGVAAETFVKNAEAAERSRGSIDFSRAFLESSCIRTVLSSSVLNRCKFFSCGNDDLDSFFLNDAVELAGCGEGFSKRWKWKIL
jgi:hypothetical protein